MPAYEITNGAELFQFAAYCTASGAIFFLIDLIACKIKSTESLLGIVYRKDNSLPLFVLWAVGAGLMGFIGGYAEVFQLTKPTVLTIGVTWPFLLTKIVKKNVDPLATEAVEREVDGEENEKS